MGKIEDLAANYERHLSAPWRGSSIGAQRVLLLIYDKELERTLRERLGEFEIKTREAGYDWVHHDCTRTFAEWLARDEYKDEYFECPEDLSMKIEGEFADHTVAVIRSRLSSADEKTVVALSGIASLYGFAHVSEIVRRLEPEIKGRLIVFFPGTKEDSNYRLLDARDGWNYLASSITAKKAEAI